MPFYLPLSPPPAENWGDRLRVTCLDWPMFERITRDEKADMRRCPELVFVSLPSDTVFHGSTGEMRATAIAPTVSMVRISASPVPVDGRHRRPPKVTQFFWLSILERRLFRGSPSGMLVAIVFIATLLFAPGFYMRVRQRMVI